MKMQLSILLLLATAVMTDGCSLYGRQCTSTGTYPTDLNQYYILFPGDFQGTENAIQ